MQILIDSEPVPPEALTFLELGFGRGGPGPHHYRIVFPSAEFLDRLGEVYRGCVDELREDDRMTGEFEPPFPGATDYPDLDSFLREHGQHFTEFARAYLKFDILRLALDEGRPAARLVVTSVDEVRAAGDEVVVEGTARAAA